MVKYKCDLGDVREVLRGLRLLENRLSESRRCIDQKGAGIFAWPHPSSLLYMYTHVSSASVFQRISKDLKEIEFESKYAEPNVGEEDNAQ